MDGCCNTKTGNAFVTESLPKYTIFCFFTACSGEHINEVSTNGLAIYAILSVFAFSVHSFDTEYIFDCNTFTSYIKDIVFFSKLKLITKPEVILLKKDLLDLINNLETKAAKGSLSPSSKISVYISSINIESSCSLIKSDNSQIAHFRVYGIGGITSFDSQLLEVHQIWIESMKRYSILITGSADLIRKEYFNEQRKAVEIMLGEDTTSDD